MAIDQDRHADKADGVEAWQAILAEHEPHETLTQVTGSDGLHALYFDTRHRATGSKLGTIIEGVDGIDLQDQRYIVAAPSVHPDTGNVYEWLNPGTPITDLPEWFYTAPRKTGASQGATAVFRPRMVREPTEIEAQAALLMENVDPFARLGDITFQLIVHGDPEESDQSKIVARICRGAAQTRFDPDRLFDLLKDEINIGGQGLRRRIDEYSEEFAWLWLRRIMLWAHQCRAQVLSQIDAMRTEAEEYDWPRSVKFVGRNGFEQSVRGSMVKKVVTAGLDVAAQRLRLDVMLGVEKQLLDLTGIKSDMTARKAVQAAEHLGWWTPSKSPLKRGPLTNAYIYTFVPDPEARRHPPNKVRSFGSADIAAVRGFGVITSTECGRGPVDPPGAALRAF